MTSINDSKKIPNDLKETIQNYKGQVGRYNKIVMSDEWDEKTELMTQAVLVEHKKKLIQAKDSKNNEGVIEVLLSLRVNALQISPELKKNLISEFIQNDILCIQEPKSNQFILDLLNIHAYNFRNAVLSIISIIASTFKGVQYILSNDVSILEKIIEILKATEDGQVIQRFCLAILQKMSIKEETIGIYMKYGLIDWLIKLLQRSRTNEIHHFCLDFASALLANIFNSNIALDFLEQNAAVYKNVTETFLGMIKEKIPTSVLMHILICLNYLSQDKFGGLREECQFFDSISSFVEYYSGVGVYNENEEIDKKTILDLCRRMSKRKDSTMDNSRGMEMHKAINEDNYKELEKEQKELIFECFSDEIN